MNIYVGNLWPEVTEEELGQEFMAFGKVMSVIIVNDNHTGCGQPTRYGFVEMASKSEGIAAIGSLNGKTLRRRTINVIQALPLSYRRGNGSHGSERDSTAAV
jgi:nucleolysin TIA-1/TIAR